MRVGVRQIGVSVLADVCLLGFSWESNNVFSEFLLTDCRTKENFVRCSIVLMCVFFFGRGHKWA